MIHIRANHNMNKFKEMTMDEQVETIDQTNQEALGVRKEKKVVEVAEARSRGILL
jgi:hypothetical protein